MADGQCAEPCILSSTPPLGTNCNAAIALYIYSVLYMTCQNSELGAAAPGSQRSNQNQLGPQRSGQAQGSAVDATGSPGGPMWCEKLGVTLTPCSAGTVRLSNPLDLWILIVGLVSS